MFGYIDKISSYLHDYCMKAVLLESQNTNLVVLPCLSFYSQNPIAQILTFFHFFALVKLFHGTGWTIWLKTSGNTGCGFVRDAVAGGGTAQHLPFPKLCWANRTVQLWGKRWSRGGNREREIWNSSLLQRKSWENWGQSFECLKAQHWVAFVAGCSCFTGQGLAGRRKYLNAELLLHAQNINCSK